MCPRGQIKSGDKIKCWALSDANFLPDLRSGVHFWIGAVAEEKNAKNSPRAGDEKWKNYVSMFLGVIWGGESKFPISSLISLVVLEIWVNYCEKKRKICFFPRGIPIKIKKNYISRFIGVIWGGEFKFPISFVISLVVLEI